ncbi:hypothetical protein NC651_021728 [Populus alba x Populus x berolinensis]|nr:hypothetical protein NC651_021728 [Populus alba x Populus x berolinensis]
METKRQFLNSIGFCFNVERAPVAGKLHPISCSAFQLAMDENLAPSDIQATTSQAYTFKLYRVRGKNEIMIKQLEITPLLKLPTAMPNQMSCEIPLAATFVQLRLHTIDNTMVFFNPITRLSDE